MLRPRITISHSEEEIEVPYVLDNMTAHERALFVKHMSKWYVKYFGRAVFMNMPYDNKLHKGRMFESKGWYFIVNKRTLLSCQVFVAHPNGSLLTCLSIYSGHNFTFRRMEKGWRFR